MIPNRDGSRQVSRRLPNLSFSKDDMPCLVNSVDPVQLASEEALFVIICVDFYQKPGSSNLIGCKLEVGMAS